MWPSLLRLASHSNIFEPLHCCSPNSRSYASPSHPCDQCSYLAPFYIHRPTHSPLLPQLKASRTSCQSHNIMNVLAPWILQVFGLVWSEFHLSKICLLKVWGLPISPCHTNSSAFEIPFGATCYVTSPFQAPWASLLQVSTTAKGHGGL